MKTITISDDVYRKLVSLKGRKSFSQIIDELIRSNVDRRVQKIIELSREEVSNLEELENVVRKIREEFRVRI